MPSKRESEVIALVSQGYSNLDIANALFISEQTVKNHLYNVMTRLQVSNRMQLVLKTQSLKGAMAQ